MSAIRLGMSLMNSSPADAGIHTPEKGRTEREQLLDAARAPVQKKLVRDDVRFEVEQIRAGDGWAFVYVRMLNADGSVLDYAGTPLADAAKQGYVSPDYLALLHARKSVGYGKRVSLRVDLGGLHIIKTKT